MLLDDPIRLSPITLSNHAGQSKTLSLQFDGSWVSGLPDVFNDLQRNGFQLTPDIEAKVIAIPAGTLVTDAVDASKQYVFKPLQVSEYLETIPDPGNLDLGPAKALDLGTVPNFIDHGMGSIPDAPVKYSEGKLVN